ncbi:MAG: hypothetical protein J0G96_01405 [Flavobacteriia bacterium]|nr:hypothetical protein [Flavobacteriia bacterium]OJX38602.1 MAG: hypothetical protein BGO87_10870 [Flavobacteriia bacterium 40-80]
MNIKRDIPFILIILFCFLQNPATGYSQGKRGEKKGTYIGVNFNGWYSRYYGEIYYLNRKTSGYGFSVSLGAGQFGKYTADGHTKNWFGRTGIPSSYGETYYKSNNIGIQTEIAYSYQFKIQRAWAIDLGIYAIGGIYHHQFEYDYTGFDDNYNWGKNIAKDQLIEFNCGLGFVLSFVWNISKKMNLVAGGKLPFYFLNPTKLSISKFFDPPLLGVEPMLTIGVRYKLN